MLAVATGTGPSETSLTLLGMIGIAVIPEEVAIAQAGDAFDGAGRLTRPHDAAALEQLAAGLLSAARKETIAA